MLYQPVKLHLGLLSSSGESRADAQIFFYLYISCLIISSCYTLIWDLKMDWGLFDRNAGENTFLREEIVYPHKVLGGEMYLNVTVLCDDTIWTGPSVCLQAYYYSAIVEDVLLRFSWTLTITLSTVVKFHGMADILATLLAPMEVFRYFSTSVVNLYSFVVLLSLRH